MLRRLRLLVCAVPLLLLGACGVQGSPDFQESYGVVDDPCATAKTPSHCTAHVYVVNHGGEGVGHVTVVVLLRDATARATSARTVVSARCGMFIPDTAAGAAVELTCHFDLPAGKAVAAVPSLQDLDFTAAEQSNGSADGTVGIATIALALVAALLALFVLGRAVAGRRRLDGSTTRSVSREEEAAEEEDNNDW